MSNSDAVTERKAKWLRHLLAPIARFCVRHRIGAAVLEEVLRSELVEQARLAIASSGGRPNIVQISVLLGMDRRQVTRLFREGPAEAVQGPGVIGQILAKWENDSRYQAKNGRPRVLSYGSEQSEFHRLVNVVTQHYHPTTILPELLRSGAVVKTKQGLKLVRATAAVTREFDNIFPILGGDIEALIQAAEENINLAEDEIGNLHHTTEFTGLELWRMPQIRRHILNEGRKFHKNLRKYLSKFDRESISGPQPAASAGGRVIVGTFSQASPKESSKQ